MSNSKDGPLARPCCLGLFVLCGSVRGFPFGLAAGGRLRRGRIWRLVAFLGCGRLDRILRGALLDGLDDRFQPVLDLDLLEVPYNFV